MTSVVVGTDEGPVYPQICVNCDHYVDRTSLGPGTKSVGTCHRYPPLAQPGGRTAIFAVVLPTFHCHEYARTEEEDTE